MIVTSKEIVGAMKEGTPIIYNGAKYIRIMEYILWFTDAGEQRTSVTLLDKNGRSVVRADSARIALAEMEKL